MGFRNYVTCIPWDYDIRELHLRRLQSQNLNIGLRDYVHGITELCNLYSPGLRDYGITPILDAFNIKI